MMFIIMQVFNSFQEMYAAHASKNMSSHQIFNVPPIEPNTSKESTNSTQFKNQLFGFHAALKKYIDLQNTSNHSPEQLAAREKSITKEWECINQNKNIAIDDLKKRYQNAGQKTKRALEAETQQITELWQNVNQMINEMDANSHGE